METTWLWPHRFDKTLEASDWEPNPMRRHGVNIVVLRQNLVVLPIDCLYLNEQLTDAKTCHLIQQRMAKVKT